MKFLYRIYQLLVVLPVTVLVTIFTALTVCIGTSIGDGHFWGYYPGRWWARTIIRICLLPVTVEGRENLEKDQSYVFVSNHQGAFDIFLIYGFLGRNFKWMMKYQLGKIPFVGYACRKSHQIFVDKRGVGKVRQTYEAARKTLEQGNLSVVVFPEGSRSFTGHMGTFKKGGFVLADELQLPDHQRFIRHHAPDPRLAFCQLASLTTDHPPAHLSRRTRHTERAGHDEPGLRQCHVFLGREVQRLRGESRPVIFH